MSGFDLLADELVVYIFSFCEVQELVCHSVLLSRTPLQLVNTCDQLRDILNYRSRKSWQVGLYDSFP